MKGALTSGGTAVRRGWLRTRRPQGQPTRGKTAANRLRRVDVFMLLYDTPLLRRQAGDFANAQFVDLGYGATPVTTLESAARFRCVNPGLPVLGVEIDPARVAAAQPFVDPLTNFRLGGFNLPLQRRVDGAMETVRAIRAFNVLRQYDEEAVAPAYAEMAQHALPGALLVEGTSTPAGDLWVANVLRRQRHAPLWRSEALVFSCAHGVLFDPGDFQTVLPKHLIHRVRPGEPVAALLAAWRVAAQRTRPARIWGERHWFVEAGRSLRAAGWPVDPRRRWLKRGFLLLRLSDYAQYFAQ